MRATVSFGRIAGIRIGVHWSALIGVLLLGQLVALTVLPSFAPGLATGVSGWPVGLRRWG